MVFRQRLNMAAYLRTHLLLQLPFGLLSELPTMMLFSPAILTQIRGVVEARVDKVNFVQVNYLQNILIIGIFLSSLTALSW